MLASIPIAYFMRGPFRGKRLLTAILVVPVTLGTVLVAEGLLRYLGPRGWFNRTLLELGILDEPLRLVHNYWGVLFSLIITGFPFAFLLILSYMSGIDPTLERAAATLGAGPWQRFRRILLPLLAPGLATTACCASCWRSRSSRRRRSSASRPAARACSRSPPTTPRSRTTTTRWARRSR